MHQHFVGLDLHSNNTFIGICDERGRRVLKQRTVNNLDIILSFLEPYKETISGVVVESTFNWYWLVDGLMENGYNVHLANPCAIQQYKGLKHTDDCHDAFFLATLLRLNILPQGYIFPKEDRHLRDLLRKRLMLVRNRTAHILSFKSLLNRNLSINMVSYRIKTLREEDIPSMFENVHLTQSAQSNIATMRFLDEMIKQIEKEVLKAASLKPHFNKLMTVPGIGKILALTISLETGDINRFKQVGHYASYCRCVGSHRLSNGKLKGQNNRKNGNKYLAWAFLEAAHQIKRYCPEAETFYTRKSLKTNKIVAIKALAHKISRACYYIIKDNAEFDVNKIFNTTTKHINKGCGSEPVRGLDNHPLAPIGQPAATAL